MDKNRKAITVRLSPELHQKLKIQLAKDNISFQEWAENKIINYVEEDEDNTAVSY